MTAAAPLDGAAMSRPAPHALLEVPRPDSPLRDVLGYYGQTISPQKRSHKTEIYRVKALATALGDLALDALTCLHVVAYRDMRLATPHPRDATKTLATSTVKLELMLLSHVFTTAMTEWGMDGLVNPVAKIRKPRSPPGRSRRITPLEERRILRAAHRHPNREFYAIIVLALQTACRQGELLSMRWENVDWQRRTIHLPLTKNGDARDVPLSRAAFGIVAEYLERKPSGKMFTYGSSGIKSSWRYFIRGLDIEDLHFHDLRHAAVSSLIERGLNTIEVSAISGHKSMAMLKRYSHLHAWKLVAKLDPQPRPKRERPLLRDQLPAYPAIVTRLFRRVDVEFPDFADLHISVSGRDEQRAIEVAQNRLLRRVVGTLCEGLVPPAPSALTGIPPPGPKGRVVMISPL